MPLVTAVLIFLNEERYLEEAVQSVREQTLTDWELILVDDGSTDGSTRIARDLAAQDERIRYVDHPRHENRGMSASRNLGVSHGNGSYIGFLDSDDVWPPDRLSEQIRLFESMPGVAMVVGAILYWYSWDLDSSRPDYVLPTGGRGNQRLDPPEAALTLYPLGPEACGGSTGLVRRSAFDAVGGFEDRFRGLYEDQAFLAKIYLRYPIYISSQTWYHYRRHDDSCSGRLRRADHVRLRGVFLEWLHSYVGPNGDTRVIAAIQRAQRRLPYKKLAVPVYEVFDLLPEALQLRLRTIAGRP